MRVLVVTHNYPRFERDPAGAFVASLAREASRRGAKVLVLAPHAPGTAEHEQSGESLELRRFRYLPERWETVGYRGDLHRLSLGKPLLALALPAFMAAFARAVSAAVREFRPDIVHAHWWLPGGLLAMRTGRPFIVTSHGSDVRLLERPLFRRLGRFVLSRASAATTVSRFLADDIRRLLPELRTPIHVTRMPVDAELFAAGQSEPKAMPPRILYAGNLVESKGVALLIDAFAILRRGGVECALRIVGDGPDAARLHTLARELGVYAEISWSPLVPQSAMPAEYGASTVTVLPSRGRAEGLGLSLVEALLAGAAIVGTPVGGIPEVIIHEQTGLLSTDERPESLAAALQRMLTEPELRARLTAAGRERVRSQFSPASAVEPFLSLYEQFADRGAP
ncbi:MAG TPA: glycosyltransferase [Gemmatimonadaceae bacterium]|nr:glycosyltransferase [Gemmatimonadaceae bacterium]